MRRTPVLYVHHRPDLGGAPLSLAELIANLDERYEPHVYVPDGPAAKLFADAGAEVHTGPVAMFVHSWDNPYKGIRWLLLGREFVKLPPHLIQLDSLLRRLRFPIVHLNEAQLLPAAALAKRSGAKVVWHLRSSLYTTGQVRRRVVVSAINRFGDAAIAIDEDVAASFPLQIPVHVIFNTAVASGEAPSAAEAKGALGLPSDVVVIAYVGHLRRIKGWETLVRAAALLRDQPVHFAFVGGGVRSPAWFTTPQGRVASAMGLADDDESHARALVAELGLTDLFTFLPFVPDLSHVYPALDIVTFPNLGVGLGRPVLEAAAYGKPVVASGSVSGGGMLVPGESVVLVRERTAEVLETELRRLVVEPDLRGRIGSRARATALERFDPARQAARIRGVYASLATSRGSGR